MNGERKSSSRTSERNELDPRKRYPTESGSSENTGSDGTSADDDSDECRKMYAPECGTLDGTSCDEVAHRPDDLDDVDCSVGLDTLGLDPGGNQDVDSVLGDSPDEGSDVGLDDSPDVGSGVDRS